MRRIARRRLTLAAITAAALAALALLHRAEELALRDAARRSGWLLFGAVALLALYGARRRFPFPPLLEASTWLQGHVWLGAASVGLYALHAGLDLPSGLVEGSLAALFAVTAGSGLAGIAIARTVPRRLTLRGHEVIAERIPALRARLRDEARSVVERVSGADEQGPLADFYARRLDDFFAGQRNRWDHLRQSQRPLQSLRLELSALDRYLSDGERRAAAELRELVEAKDALDYHAALQGLMRGWLLVHVPATAALLALALVHALLALGVAGARP